MTSDNTLEPRGLERKHPIGFTSQRLELIRAGHDPTPAPAIAAVSAGPTRRDVLNGLIQMSAPVGRAIIVGSVVLGQAVSDWLDQPA